MIPRWRKCKRFPLSSLKVYSSNYWQDYPAELGTLTCLDIILLLLFLLVSVLPTQIDRNTTKVLTISFILSVCNIIFTVLPSTWLSSQPPGLVSQQGTGLCQGPQPAQGSAYGVVLDVCALLWLCGWEPQTHQDTLGSDWKGRQVEVKNTATQPKVQTFKDAVLHYPVIELGLCSSLKLSSSEFLWESPLPSTEEGLQTLEQLAEDIKK